MLSIVDLTKSVWFASLIIPLVVCCASSAAASGVPPPGRQYSEPFRAIENYCAWPNLTQLSDGTIIATVFNQPSHGALVGDAECWASVDGGWTWQYRGTPARHVGDSNRMNVAAGLAGNGDLIVLGSGYTRPAEGFSSKLPAAVCRSSDGGVTWVVSSDFPSGPDGQMYTPFGDIHTGLDGSLCVSAYNGGGSYLLASADDGANWELRSVVSEKHNETAPFHLGGGKWLAAARTNDPAYPNEPLDLFASDDDGRTWRLKQRVTAEGQHPGHLMRLTDGRLLLTYGDRRPEHLGVGARLSDDEGESWGEPIRIADTPGAIWDEIGYPGCVQRADGKIVTAYYICTEDEGYSMSVVVWELPSAQESPKNGADTDLPTPRLLDVRKIWDQAPHNAFTDLIRFKGEWLCTFREAEHHSSDDGKLRVIGSKGGTDWESVALISYSPPEGYAQADLRDPKLSVTPTGDLMMTGVVDLPSAGTRQSLVWFSPDGRSWSEAHEIGERGEWLWRTTWHRGIAYNVAYNPAEESYIQLYSSTDGIAFEKRGPRYFTDGSYANEHSLVFLKDDTCLCLLRRDDSPAIPSGAATAQLGTAAPPYAEWTWKDLGVQIGGPEMIQLPDGRFLAAVRLHDSESRTALCWLDPEAGTLTEFMRLPSGGDTSYAGMVWHEDALWISYYSSHEGKTSIYLARLHVPAPTPVDQEVIDIGTRKQLLIDDHIVASADNAHRILNQPVEYEGNPIIELEPPQKVDGEDLPDSCSLLAPTAGDTPEHQLTRKATSMTELYAAPRGFTIPLIDLACQKHRQIVVDREPGQYLGHPTTVLLEDNRTMIAVYPKGHGAGAIVMKRSRDAGLTWSERLPVPDNWATSQEVPTIHRVVAPGNGKKRLILFSGLYPIRMSVSEDDGCTWTPLAPIGDFGGIVTMASVERLKDGSHMALFHDDGRFLRGGDRPEAGMRVYKTVSVDGGLTWSEPEMIATHATAHLCEPGLVRSPDGHQIAVLLRENSRQFNSFVIFSGDEGETWAEPRELPGALTGDRHTGKYAPDGRLFISFRDMTHESPTHGDWVGWVGTYDDILQGREGQYRVRLMDNMQADWDCAYPGVEALPDGTIVTTTYGHWIAGEPPFIVSVRLKLSELDELAAARPK